MLKKLTSKIKLIRTTVFRKGSIMNYWLLSYGLILLILMLFGSSIYIVSTNRLSDVNQSRNKAVLKQSQLSIDNLLYQSKKLTLQVSLNNDVINFADVKAPLTTDNRYEILEICNELQSYILAEEIVDNFYVYFNNSNIILSSDGQYSPEMFYRLFLSQSDFTYTEFMDKLTKQNRQSFETVKGNINRIMSLNTILTNADNRVVCTAISFIEESRIRSITADLNDLYESDFYIMDVGNNILYSSRAGSEEILPNYGKLISSDNYVLRRYKNTIYFMTFVTSEITNWKYICSVSANEITKDMQYINILAIIMFILCLIISLFVAYKSLRRNYNLLYGVIDQIVDRNKLHSNEIVNEYNFIAQAVNNAYDEKDALMDQIDKQLPLQRADLINRILRGSISKNYPINEMMSQLEVKFTHNDFFVVIIETEGSDERFDYDAGNAELAKFAVSNVAHEILGNHFHINAVQNDDKLVCIIDINEGRDTSDAIRTVCEEISEILKSKLGIEVTIAISRGYKTLDGICSAYNEAIDMMEYRLLEGEGSILDAKRLNNPNDSITFNSGMWDQKLMNVIKAGDGESAEILIDQFFEEYFKKKNLNIGQAKCIIFSIINTVASITEEINAIFSVKFGDEEKYINEILSCTTISDMKHEIKVMIAAVCDYVKENSSKKKNDDLIERIDEYIKENYSDVNLCLSTTADYFKMYPSNFSKFYKDKTGRSLLDTISDVRIEHAKQCLAEGMTIADTAEAVGYVNSNSFIRAFKKKENITPGQYKNMI